MTPPHGVSQTAATLHSPPSRKAEIHSLIAEVHCLIFLLGWTFEWPAIILVFLPIFYPVVEALKYDPAPVASPLRPFGSG